MVAWRKDHVTVLVPTSCLSMKKDNSLFLYIYECGSRNSDWKRLNHTTSSLKKLAVIHRSFASLHFFLFSLFRYSFIYFCLAFWRNTVSRAHKPKLLRNQWRDGLLGGQKTTQGRHFSKPAVPWHYLDKPARVVTSDKSRYMRAASGDSWSIDIMKGNKFGFWMYCLLARSLLAVRPAGCVCVRAGITRLIQ